MYLQPENMPQT